MPKSKEEIKQELQRIHDQVVKEYGNQEPKISDLTRAQKNLFEEINKRPLTKFDVTTAIAIQRYQKQEVDHDKGCFGCC